MAIATVVKKEATRRKKPDEAAVWKSKSGISRKHGILEDMGLAKLMDEAGKKHKRNGRAKEANDSHRDELEIMAGRKITDLENYYRSG